MRTTRVQPRSRTRTSTYKGRQQTKMYNASMQQSTSGNFTGNYIKYKILNWVLSTVLFALIYNATVVDDPLSTTKWRDILILLVVTGLIANVIARIAFKVTTISSRPHDVKVYVCTIVLYSLLLLFGLISWIFDTFPVFPSGIDSSLLFNVMSLLFLTKIIVWAMAQLIVFTMEKWFNN